MVPTVAKCIALSLALATGVGSRGPVKYTEVTISKLKKGYWSVSVTYPHFQSASAVTALANHDLMQLSQTWVHEWATGITKDMEKPITPWLEEYTPTVVSARGELVSLQMTQYSDTEGAHPNTLHLTLNFGFVGDGAKLLTLKDLFKPGTQALAIVSKIVIAKLKEKDASWIQDGTVKLLDAKQGDEFVIKPDRLTYIFSPYEMGSYAEGTYEIDVPFATIAAKLNPTGPLRVLLRK